MFSIIVLTKMWEARRTIASTARNSPVFHRFGQLQQIVNRADQAPFALRLLKTTQHELPEPSSLFYLAEDRFNDRLAQPIPTASAGSCQLGSHCCHPGTLGAASAGGARLVMALAPGGDVTIYMMTSKNGEVAFGAVWGLGSNGTENRVKRGRLRQSAGTPGDAHATILLFAASVEVPDSRIR